MSNESIQKPCVPLRSVRIRAVGDIMFCKGQLAYARKSGGTFSAQKRQRNSRRGPEKSALVKNPFYDIINRYFFQTVFPGGFPS